MGFWDDTKNWVKSTFGIEQVNETTVRLMKRRATLEGYIRRFPNHQLRPQWEATIADIDATLSPYGIDLTDGLTQDDWDEILRAMPEILSDVGEEVIGEIGDLSLAFVRGFAGAFIEGLENAYDLVAQKLSGKEPEVIASITAGVLVILVSTFLWGEVRRGPKGD